MNKNFFCGIAIAAMLATACGANAQSPADNGAAEPSTVYFIREISPESLVKIYKALGREATGNVAVKISTGESEKSHQLDPDLIADFVKEVNGTLVECNTAYDGNRRHTAEHLKAVEQRGYNRIAKVDIMDATEEVAIPVKDGIHLDKDIVGKNFLNYDFLVVLSHMKGHQMGGFGGALKNISIGIASSNGKAYIHSAGKTANADSIWRNIAEQDMFLESMADACKGVIEHVGKNKALYINVANNMSIDCDCNGNPAKPEMADLGILASLDPVALDRASVDMILNADDPHKASMIERINSRHGTHTIDVAEKHGLGTQNYKIVEIR